MILEFYWNSIGIMLLGPLLSCKKAPVQDVTATFAINNVNGDMNGFYCFQHNLQAAVIKADELH